MKSLYESILSSTGAGKNAIQLKPIIEFLQFLKSENELGSCSQEDIYLPEKNSKTRFENVFRFNWEKSKKNTREHQLAKALKKAGYVSEHDTKSELYDVNRPQFHLNMIDRIDPRLYYSPFEHHVDRYWDYRIFRIEKAIMLMVMEKYPKDRNIHLYVIALNEDGMTPNYDVLLRLKNELGI